jgi:hypothetical protein
MWQPMYRKPVSQAEAYRPLSVHMNLFPTGKWGEMHYYMTNFLTVPWLCVFPSFPFSFGVSSFYSSFHNFFFICFFTYIVIHPMWYVSDTLSKQAYWLQDSGSFHPYIKAHIFNYFWQNYEKQLLASSYLSVCLSVHQHGTACLPLNRLSWNFIFMFVLKIFYEN